MRYSYRRPKSQPDEPRYIALPHAPADRTAAEWLRLRGVDRQLLWPRQNLKPDRPPARFFELFTAPDGRIDFRSEDKPEGFGLDLATRTMVHVHAWLQQYLVDHYDDDPWLAQQLRWADWVLELTAAELRSRGDA